jgi:hypothetical protein
MERVGRAEADPAGGVIGGGYPAKPASARQSQGRAGRGCGGASFVAGSGAGGDQDLAQGTGLLQEINLFTVS